MIKKQRILGILMLAVLLGLLIPLLYFTDERFIECPTEPLDEGWDASVHQKEYHDITVSKTLFEMCNKGDVLTFTRKLSSDIRVQNPVLQCYSVHSVVEVFLDGELIYSYGKEYYENGQLLGYGMNYIQLPEDYAGKELKIVYTVSENNAFEGLPGFAIADGHSMVQHALASGRVGLASNLFLIMFGVIGMVLSLCMLFNNPVFMRTFCISVFSLLIGCWTLCNNDMITFFVQNLSIKVYFEYLSFYLLPIPFTCYFRENIKKDGVPKKLRVFFWTLLAAELALVVFAVLLQALNLVHLPVWIGLDHILVIGVAVFVVCIAVVNYRENRRLDPGITIGFGLTVIMGMFELVRYNLSKYLTGFTNNKYDSTLSFAALVIVIALFADFGSKITKNLYREAQNKVLQKMAYVDELTTLANRRKCDEVMMQLQDGQEGYAIVSMDMNLLKYINDTYGHEMGDYALQQFAQVLKTVFPASATVGRMGGDEFIAIVPNADSAEIDRYVENMQQEMQLRSQKEDSITLSAAYGCAFSSERKDAHAVYSLADERMYECKRAMKMGRR